MQNFILILTILLAGIFIPANAQSRYETEMQKAMEAFGKSQTRDDMERVAQHFDRIAKMESENWIPLYYSIFVRTLIAFSLDKDKAIRQVDELENLYSKLDELSPKNSEILTLRGLFRTVKVAKDPDTYAMSLSGAIIKDYDDALKLNPENPRAMYLMAQYNMGGAEFWGKDPKDYCPQIERAKQLLESEKKENFEPDWGKDQINEILDTTCKK